MKAIKAFLVLALLVFGIYLAVDRSLVNLDHLNQGRLVWVKIEDLSCAWVECVQPPDPLKILDEPMLRELESIFFMKPTMDLLGYTKEMGRYKFDFKYEKETIVFYVVINEGSRTGKIKYPAKHFDYALRPNEIKRLLEDYLKFED